MTTTQQRARRQAHVRQIELEREQQARRHRRRRLRGDRGRHLPPLAGQCPQLPCRHRCLGLPERGTHAEDLGDLTGSDERADGDQASIARRKIRAQPQVAEKNVSGVLNDARRYAAELLADLL